MEYRVNQRYTIKETPSEINVKIDGKSFLTIYGQHVNGYFICIPLFGIGCEAKEPHSIEQNMQKLINAGLTREYSYAVSMALAEEFG